MCVEFVLDQFVAVSVEPVEVTSLRRHRTFRAMTESELFGCGLDGFDILNQKPAAAIRKTRMVNVFCMTHEFFHFASGFMGVIDKDVVGDDSVASRAVHRGLDVVFQTVTDVV